MPTVRLRLSCTSRDKRGSLALALTLTALPDTQQNTNTTPHHTTSLGPHLGLNALQSCVEQWARELRVDLAHHTAHAIRGCSQVGGKAVELLADCLLV